MAFFESRNYFNAHHEFSGSHFACHLSSVGFDILKERADSERFYLLVKNVQKML